MYSDVLLDRFHTPTHAGDLEQSTSNGKQGNPTCGDVVEIALRLSDGYIEEARFRTLGCAVAIAASDLICEMVEGMPSTSAQVLDLTEISERLGGVPEERWQCISAPLAALQDALPFK
jgi:nitrogen fixation NifU-like protein